MQQHLFQLEQEMEEAHTIEIESIIKKYEHDIQSIKEQSKREESRITEERLRPIEDGIKYKELERVN